MGWDETGNGGGADKMRHPLIEETEKGRTGAAALTRPLPGARTVRPPGRPPEPVALELVLPVRDTEDTVAEQLTQATSSLLTLGVPAAVAVVDGGSSDRTIEVVDEVAAGSLVPVRVLGCSTPGWAAAVRRGIGTSRAGWVGFGEAGAFPADLDHAVRLLADGKHVVCLGSAGHRITVAHRSVADLFLDDEGPQLKDIPQHAGIRMTAHGRSRIADRTADTTLVMTRTQS
jgi:hypothetical protein